MMPKICTEQFDQFLFHSSKWLCLTVVVLQTWKNDKPVTQTSKKRVPWLRLHWQVREMTSKASLFFHCLGWMFLPNNHTSWAVNWKLQGSCHERFSQGRPAEMFMAWVLHSSRCSHAPFWNSLFSLHFPLISPITFSRDMSCGDRRHVHMHTNAWFVRMCSGEATSTGTKKHQQGTLLGRTVAPRWGTIVPNVNNTVDILHLWAAPQFLSLMKFPSPLLHKMLMHGQWRKAVDMSRWWINESVHWENRDWGIWDEEKWDQDCQRQDHKNWDHWDQHHKNWDQDQKLSFLVCAHNWNMTSTMSNQNFIAMRVLNLSQVDTFWHCLWITSCALFGDHDQVHLCVWSKESCKLWDFPEMRLLFACPWQEQQRCSGHLTVGCPPTTQHYFFVPPTTYRRRIRKDFCHHEQIPQNNRSRRS